jgi:hypothetical protein
MTLLRRGFLWLYLLTASVVVVGVFVQAFSIAAYARGAGSDALDLHTSVGFLVHSIEIVVFLLTLVAFWGAWRIVGFAALLPVVGTLQLFLIGDTDESGNWVNGLHGLLALVVLLLALALVWIGVRSLARRAAPPPVWTSPLTLAVAPPPGTAWWRRRWRVIRFERGVFAEIAVDGQATWHGLGALLAASLIGPSIVRAVADTQRVRIAVAITAVVVPVLLYIGFLTRAGALAR